MIDTNKKISLRPIIAYDSDGSPIRQKSCGYTISTGTPVIVMEIKDAETLKVQDGENQYEIEANDFQVGPDVYTIKTYNYPAKQFNSRDFTGDGALQEACEFAADVTRAYVGRPGKHLIEILTNQEKSLTIRP